MTKKIRIVTHNSRFHADDLFAVATLLLLVGEGETEVLRSRDEETITTADYVVDVGNVYDPATNRFDHHQEGGAGKRENGIPYAAFGLVWKEYGEKICGSTEVAQSIEKLVVQPIDARDNGLEICEPIFKDVHPYGVGRMAYSFSPTWEEEKTHDEGFFEALAFVKTILANEIKTAKSIEKARVFVEDAYAHAADKRLVIMPEKPALDREVIATVLIKFPEPLYYVNYRPVDDIWQISCVRKDRYTFENRKPFPEAWAGKRDAELAAITGVSDAVFCHNARFMCVAKSKEGALALARLALESS